MDRTDGATKVCCIRAIKQLEELGHVTDQAEADADDRRLRI